MRGLVLAVLVMLCAVSVLSAADDEQPRQAALADSFVFVAADGVMVADANFTGAKFHALPKAVECRLGGEPWLFENTDNTLFIFYPGEDALWSCHFDAGGWTVEKIAGCVPHTLERIDDATFSATCLRDQNVLEDEDVVEVVEKEAAADVWTGTVHGSEVRWNKTGETVITVCNTRYTSCGCCVEIGEMPEWETEAELARPDGGFCAIQYRTQAPGRFRFQAGKPAAQDEPETEALNGCEFELDEDQRPVSIVCFEWNKKDIESLQVLLLATSAPREGRKGGWRWLLCKRGGAEHTEVFADEWQGRTVLKALDPHSGRK